MRKLIAILLLPVATCGCSGGDTAGSAAKSVGDATLTIDGISRDMDYVACSTASDRPFVITFAGDEIKRDDYVNVTMYVNLNGGLKFDTAIVWEKSGDRKVWKQSDGISRLENNIFAAEGTLSGEQSFYGEDGREKRTPLEKDSTFSLRVECRG